MKRFLSALFVTAIVVGLSSPAFCAEEKGAPPPPSTVAATVNGHKIMESDVNEELNQGMISAMGRIPDNPQQAAAFRERFHDKALDRVIKNHLLQTEAEKQGITVSDAEVKAILEEQFEMQFASMGRTRQDYVDTTLKPQGVTWDQFIGSFSQNPEIKKDVRLRKLIQKLYPETGKISEEKIRKYYDDNQKSLYEQAEQVRASHILIDTRAAKTPEEKAQLKKKAEEVLALAKKPDADFAALAGQHSNCASRERGGDLDFFTEDKMVPPFSQAAFSLAPGQISDLVETQFGYHIIKVTDKRPAKTISYEAAKPSIRLALETQEFMDHLGQYAKQLQDAAKVEYPSK